MSHVSLKRHLLDEVTDDLFNDLVEERLKLRTGSKTARAIVSLCISGRHPLASMTTVFADYLEADIGGGDMKIKLEDGVLMDKNPCLTPLYRICVGKAYITLGDPGTPEYAKNLRLVLEAKLLRHAIFYPGPIPAGGIKELKELFPRLEVLQCPINVIPADVQNAFPYLLNLTTDGSASSILKFFENAGNLPSLKYFCGNVGGNVEAFINDFPTTRTPRLKIFVMTAFHYADATFDKVDMFAHFANAFPRLVSVAITVIQTSVVFNPDPAFYVNMHQKFIMAEPNANLSLILQHTPTTEPIRGHELDHEDVKQVLQPIGYFINKDNSGYCKMVGTIDHGMTHHVLIDLPPPARVRLLTRAQ
uniref:Triplex capsid protein 1 n=1 Tax=Panagrellus redivivus TaxID=6233 RepID=A0A7E4VR94_PANRE